MAISSINTTQSGAFSPGVPTPPLAIQPASVQPASATQTAQSAQSVSGNSVGLDQVQKATDQINKVVQGLDKNLQFKVDHDSGRIVVQVMDTENNKIIKQFPSEEVLAISKALDKLQGLLIRQQA